MDDHLRELIARLEICIKDHEQAKAEAARRLDALEACRADLLDHLAATR